jgi:hypothetical protein
VVLGLALVISVISGWPTPVDRAAGKVLGALCVLFFGGISLAALVTVLRTGPGTVVAITDAGLFHRRIGPQPIDSLVGDSLYLPTRFFPLSLTRRPNRQQPSRRTSMKRMSSSARTSATALSAVLLAAVAICGPAAAQPAADVITPLCPLPVDPIPSGPVGKPAETFNVPGDYFWAHSGTHLQGRPALEKWGWGFYTPPGVFSGFRTAVIVDNPFPGTTVTVDIEYRDTAGNLLATTAGVTITPECFYHEQATPLAAGGGLGSIRVVSTDGNQFVGATIHHSYTIGTLVDPDFLSPGLASMQQLQRKQANASTLYAGPFPAVNLGGDPYAFNTGNLPTFQVVNPNNAVNTLTVSMASPQLGGVFFTNTVTLAPFGSYIDLFLFNALIPFYSPPAGGLNADVVVTVTSQDGLPIIGEQLMMDFFDQALNPLGRFRMGSAMMESTPSFVLINPELSFTLSGPPVNTLMAIANVGTGNAGPVRIQYRSQAGVLLGTDVIASLPPGGVQRIAPGEPGIVNYPVTWDGTVRILACDRLIGWTMRQVEPDPFGAQQFRKVYGETLDNTTGLEPGTGFAVFTLGRNLIRKASPIERIWDSSFWWPGYNAIANYSVSNIGNYWFRSFEGVGSPPFACTETTNFAPQPFAGLPWGQASFTFKDGVATPLALPPFPGEHLGTVDHQTGAIRGIDVIGDPLREWGLGFPSGPPPPPPPDEEIDPFAGDDGN